MKEQRTPQDRHTERKDLAGEHRLGDVGQIVLFVVFLATWITDSFIWHYSTFPADFVAIYVRVPIALVIVAIAIYFIKAGHRIILDEVRETPVVVRKGIFGVVRHPMYLGAMLFYLGLVVGTLSIAAAVLWVIIVSFHYYIARYEEGLLIAKFGDYYREYMTEVPMWFPRFKSR